MSQIRLEDLQQNVQDGSALVRLSDYFNLAFAFNKYIAQSQTIRIISPSHKNYIFFQYSKEINHKITRPLNTNLFIEKNKELEVAYKNFRSFLESLYKYKQTAALRPESKQLIEANELNKVVYTVQQAIGCIGDSFSNDNQSRKRIGQLFENLIKLIIKEIGFECEPRTVKIPLPGYTDHKMSYELDLVFSKNKAIVTSETTYIGKEEVVGSVKTTSKDRIDKVFLDKFLLTRLLKRNIPVIAIFLHDVQRAKRGNSIFGVNTTFKTNHFLGYTLGLNKLDGVYYVDPRPEMVSNEKLREQINDFQQLLVKDLWALSK